MKTTLACALMIATALLACAGGRRHRVLEYNAGGAGCVLCLALGEGGLKDWSDNDLTMATVNGPTWTADGYEFVKGSSQGLTAASDSDLDNPKNCTVIVRFNCDDSADKKVLFWRERLSDNDSDWRVQLWDSPMESLYCMYGLADGAGNTGYVENATISYSINTWHTMAWRQSYDDDTVWMHKDGPQSGTYTIAQGGARPLNEGDVMRIGFNDGLGRYYDGTISDILIYNRSLSSNEVRELTAYLEGNRP